MMKTVLIIFLFSIFPSQGKVVENNEELIKEAKNELLDIKLLIVHFKLRHGRFPKGLNELKCDGKDPWGRKYIYKKNPKRFLKFDLYSLGVDGIKSKDDIHVENARG